ncbi:MAG: glycosyltransferase family 2 protein [Bacteroidetes bacterium]|nr:glycosyltransferase family 2 protein [Bacteroidota bacterium]
MNKFKDPVAAYLAKRGLHLTPDYQNFSGFKEVVVVVPCYNELENLPFLLDSFLANDTSTFEKIASLFVINHPENAASEIKNSSSETVRLLTDFGSSSPLPVAIIDMPGAGREVPVKFAGAGYPRKTGLDSAISLTDHARPGNSLLVSVDADCLVAPSYFTRLVELAQRGCKAAVLEYKHREDDAENIEAIREYEACLRSYTDGLKYAGSPYAWHFIGSTMVSNVSTYVKAGGMNTRRAAEDFYFLENIAKVTKIESIEEVLVFPSNRVSDRVIFGTGKAMNDRKETGKAIKPYPPIVFERLKTFLSVYHEDYTSVEKLIDAIRKTDEETFVFLESCKFSIAMRSIYKSSKSGAQISNQKNIWFDALKTMRLVSLFRTSEP